jgi:hypothetical protein
MKFPKTPKPESVTDRSGTRQALEHPYFTGSEIVATDGRAIVVIPVEAEPGDLAGYIPSAALSAARREDGRLALASADEVWIRDRGWRRPKAVFPKWQQALDEAAPKPGAFRVRFAVEVLRSVLIAVGGENVTLTFNPADPHAAVLIDGIEARGAVMPMRLADDGGAR